MKFRSLALAVAALAISTTPVLAQVSVDATSSAEVSRDVEKKKDKSELEGTTGIIAAVVAAAAVIAGIVIIADDDDDDDEPTSP